MATSDKQQVVARDKDGREVGISRELRDHGPLPSPEDVEKYGAIIPDFGDRIMKMAEQRQENDIKYRDAASCRNHAQITLGQRCVAMIGLCGYGIAIFALMRGYPWICGGISTVLTVCLTTLVAISRLKTNGGEKIGGK